MSDAPIEAPAVEQLLEPETPHVMQGNSNIPDLDESSDRKYLGHIQGPQWDVLRRSALTSGNGPHQVLMLKEIAYQVRCRRLNAPTSDPAPAVATPEPKPSWPPPEAPTVRTIYQVPPDKLQVILMQVLLEQKPDMAGSELVTMAKTITEKVNEEFANQ